MTTLIKAKLKKSDRLKNIDKYRVAAHKILNIIIIELKSKILYMDILTFVDFNLETLCLLHLT